MNYGNSYEKNLHKYEISHIPKDSADALDRKLDHIYLSLSTLSDEVDKLSNYVRTSDQRKEALIAVHNCKTTTSDISNLKRFIANNTSE